MPSHFDFLSEIPRYQDGPGAIRRLEQRHKLIIDPFVDEIENARVLDVGCHDGRWSYALAQAGARKVVGVEARKGLTQRFNRFADSEAKERVQLFSEDMLDFISDRAAREVTFDVVALYGILYHTMEHMRLMRLIALLKPKIIIIDSEFINADNAIIQVLWEETSNPLNAVVPNDILGRTLVGVPSRRTMEFLAESIGYEAIWLNPDLILGDNREGMEDYFREGRKTRGTCVLVPKEGIAT